MGRYAQKDPGLPGTTRAYRMMTLMGLTQSELGARCNPPVKQAIISRFEEGRLWLHPKLLARIASGLFEDLYQREPAMALWSTWRQYELNVRSGTSELVKSRLEQFRQRHEWWIKSLRMRSGEKAAA